MNSRLLNAIKAAGALPAITVGGYYPLDAPAAVIQAFGVQKLADVDGQDPNLMGQHEFVGADPSGTWVKVGWDEDAGAVDELFPTRTGIRCFEVEMDITYTGGGVPRAQCGATQTNDTSSALCNPTLEYQGTDGQGATIWRLRVFAEAGSLGSVGNVLLQNMAVPYLRVGIALDFDNERVYVVAKEDDGTLHTFGWLDSAETTFNNATGAFGIINISGTGGDTTVGKAGLWTEASEFLLPYPSGARDRAGNEVVS